MCYRLCKPQNVNLGGKEILLRVPKASDLRGLLKFINSLVREDAPILINRISTMKDEINWLKDKTNLINKNKLHLFVAICDGGIVGSLELRKGNWRQSHIATLGISVSKNFRGIGLGKLLMKKAVELSKKDLEIKVLTLTVYEPNVVARKLYEKIGFKAVSKLHKRSLLKGKYVDELVMDYPLKKI